MRPQVGRHHGPVWDQCRLVTEPAVSERAHEIPRSPPSTPTPVPLHLGVLPAITKFRDPVHTQPHFREGAMHFHWGKGTVTERGKEYECGQRGRGLGTAARMCPVRRAQEKSQGRTPWPRPALHKGVRNFSPALPSPGLHGHWWHPDAGLARPTEHHVWLSGMEHGGPVLAVIEPCYGFSAPWFDGGA